VKTTLRLIIVSAALLLALAPSAAVAATAKTSLSDVEDEVMCPSCHEPLALAQSPQAIAERNFIRTLIAQGQTKAEIKQALVAQYGTSVLARPPAQGFNLTVYVLPPALLLAGLAVLALTLPRWRRRAKARTGVANPPTSTSKPSTEDERRLDEDLARYG
jgi:cytochrome c-type biogenesis protein CcmH